MSFMNGWFAGSVCSRSGPSSTAKPLRYTVMMVRFGASAGGVKPLGYAVKVRWLRTAVRRTGDMEKWRRERVGAVAS